MVKNRVVRNSASRAIQCALIYRQYSAVVSKEVREALAKGLPVVALESTIISHGGIPYPRNLEIGCALEDVVRKGGAVPATCAVVNGIPRVGLTNEELHIIAKASVSHPVMKASRRDLGYAVASKRTASTTVSGTMVLAGLAGVRIFATGGIGGVHREVDGSPSIDISADLTELAKTPVTVVCAGVKSILHIPATLEVLETYGVPVITYGSTQFPAFYTADSGIPSPLVVETPLHVADIMRANDALGMKQGIVLAVPTPEPMVDAKKLQVCIDEALTSAAREGITGPRITPYILSAVTRLTGGASLEANVKLVMHNARVATEVAVAFAASTQPDAAPEALITPRVSLGSAGGVLVLGGAAWDSISTLDVHPHRMNASNPGSTANAPGGVGRNVAAKISSLGAQVSLVSVVAHDDVGQQVLRGLRTLGVDVSGVRVLDDTAQRTAQYTAIHARDGELIVSAADMRIFDQFRLIDVCALRDQVRTARLVVADANFGPDVVGELARLCRELQRPLFLEPTSDYKARRLAACISLVDVIKPNVTELVCVMEELVGTGDKGSGSSALRRALNTLRRRDFHASQEISIEDICELSQELWKALNREAPTTSLGKHVVTSLGDRGAVWASQTGVCHIPTEKIELLRLNTNGAGDTLMAGLISQVLLKGCLDVESIQAAVALARSHILSQSVK